MLEIWELTIYTYIFFRHKPSQFLERCSLIRCSFYLKLSLFTLLDKDQVSLLSTYDSDQNYFNVHKIVNKKIKISLSKSLEMCCGHYIKEFYTS